MRVPHSVKDAYEEIVDALGPLREIAGNRLSDLCRKRGWLFDDRVKSVESVLSKLETGALRSLDEMRDIYAAMVVVPTQAEVPAAVDALRDIFECELRPRRNLDASRFAYDDQHIYARLGDRVPPQSLSEALRQWMFEVQIHTGLQYAWWRATHDTLYKGGSRSWATERVASQARAALELLDTLLDDLPATAKLQSSFPDNRDPDHDRIRDWLNMWRPEYRPKDVLRFVDSAASFLRAAELTVDAVEAELRADASANFVSRPDVTPLQAILIVIHRLGGGPALAARRHLLITDEIRAYEPGLSAYLSGAVVLKR